MWDEDNRQETLDREELHVWSGGEVLRAQMRCRWFRTREDEVEHEDE